MKSTANALPEKAWHHYLDVYYFCDERYALFETKKRFQEKEKRVKMITKNDNIK
jgi:hypothetical protein